MKAHTIKKIYPGNPGNDVPEVHAYYHYPELLEGIKDKDKGKEQQLFG